MFKRLSLWQIWGLALSLIAFDIALISVYFGPANVVGAIDESNWDFRIAELRNLETKPQTDVAGVSVSRASVNEVVATPTPTPYFIDTAVTHPTKPTQKPWQMSFGSWFDAFGSTTVDHNPHPLN